MTIVNGRDFFIQWRVTERCNQSCPGCPLLGSSIVEMSFEDIAAGVNEIMLTLNQWQRELHLHLTPIFFLEGGEPLVRDDIFEIIRLMRRHGTVFILSNGTLIDRRAACRLAECGANGVQILLEGMAEVHDDICGAGSFQDAVEGIRRLLAADISVTINMVLSRHNIHCIPDMVALAGNLGVQRLGFSRSLPPSGGKIPGPTMLDREEVVKIYRSLFSVSIPGLEIITGDPVAAQLHASAHKCDDRLPFAGCAAGISTLNILADGTMTPCRRLEIPVGNVRTDSINLVWRSSEVLGNLRDRKKYSGECANCGHWTDCRGCRGIAYAWSKANGCDDYLAEDPQCTLISNDGSAAILPHRGGKYVVQSRPRGHGQ